MHFVAFTNIILKQSKFNNSGLVMAKLKMNRVNLLQILSVTELKLFNGQIFISYHNSSVDLMQFDV